MRPCDVETAEDFRRYYARGWIGLPDGGVIHPLGIMQREGREAEEPLIFVRIVQTDNNKFGLAPSEKWTWKTLQEQALFGRPQIGMVDNRGTISYCASLAERSSHRGLDLTRLNAYHFNKWDLREKLENLLEPNHSGRNDIVWNYFNNKYYSLPAAYDLLQAGERVGCPLSPNYGLFTVANCPHPLLAYKKWTAGFVPNPYLVVIDERFRDYREEVTKMFQIEVRIG